MKVLAGTGRWSYRPTFFAWNDYPAPKNPFDLVAAGQKLKIYG